MSSGPKELLDSSEHYQELCKKFKVESKGHYYSISDDWLEHYYELLEILNARKNETL